MKKVCIFVLVIHVILIGAAAAQAQTPQATLNQYIVDLQKNPNDYALREKIIKHVQTMKPKPAVPEEARRHFIEGNTLLKAAKDQRSYGLARDAYRQCLLVAPWWADAYNNYAVALELSGQFDDAANALKLYIATNPGESEARKAQDKIYEMGAKKKIAAQEKEPSAPKAVSAPPQNAFEDLLRKIDGRRYATWDRGLKVLLDVRGRTFVQGYLENNGSYRELNRAEIRGREFTEPEQSKGPAGIAWVVERNWSISESGESVTLRARWTSGEIEQLIYRWQR